MSIGQKIKHLRFKKNLEQNELAELIGMSSEMVSLYERNKNIPSPKAIKKIAKVFEVTPDYFLQENTEEITAIRNFNETNTKKDDTITEKLYEELKKQIDFLQTNFSRVVEENGRLTKIVDNLTAGGNFPEGNNQSTPLYPEGVVILKVA